MAHQLGGVVIEIIDRNVFDADTGCVPCHETVFMLVDAKEQLQHGNQRDKGKTLSTAESRLNTNAPTMYFCRAECIV